MTFRSSLNLAAQIVLRAMQHKPLVSDLSHQHLQIGSMVTKHKLAVAKPSMPSRAMSHCGSIRAPHAKARSAEDLRHVTHLLMASGNDDLGLRP